MSGEVIGVVPTHINNGKIKVVNGGHMVLNGKLNGKVKDSNGLNGLNGSQKSSISVPQLIAKKRDGKEFSADEIKLLIGWLVNKEMQHSQLGAILMAIYLKGMSLNETIELTKQMKESGDEFCWPQEWEGLMVDKHSTGGVGDKVSLALAPALAACGVKVPMISGRGLGFTGGTLDKLESIPGFKVSQSTTNVKNILANVGCCIVGQTDTLVPADRIMYAIRDVTSTTDSIPLMAASIISKKAAENLSGLVLDVKYGRGAFLKTYQDARTLAKTLVNVSNGQGMKTTAVLSNMNYPLGRTVGNAVEVAEAIQCLQGEGPQSLTTLVVMLGAQLLHSTGKVASVDDGIKMLSSVLENGSALEKFRSMIVAQGTAQNVASDLCAKGSDPFLYLPQAKYQTDLKTTSSGYVNDIDALACAEVSNSLGAGRTKAGQDVDLAVGLVFSVDVGSFVKEGDSWVTIHHNSELLESSLNKLEHALTIKSEPPNKADTTMIREVIHSDTE